MKFAAVLTSSLMAGTAAFVPSTSNAARKTTSLSNDFFGEPSDGGNKEMSKALPFMQRPKMLNGALAGDVGFE